ncbi:MAG TPA: S8 family serine peptidase [Thermoplasmata archaeon]|jgi:serine protease AprX|nr:S8 family serine peptidase [Thermoplasmata archaeon]
MVAGQPPPAGPVVPDDAHRGPLGAFLAIAVALLIIFSGVTVFWFVTGTGPFTVIEPSAWAFTMTQVTDLQARGLNGGGVTVCLVDSGIDTANAELTGVDLVAWRDFVNNRPQPYDDQGHGTAMAGIIFARGRLTGVAKSASLVAVKAITSAGSGTDSDIAAAIDFCTVQAADVISLSLGGEAHPFLGSLTDSAADRALDAGIFVVAAAGNDGLADDGDVESPASVTRVIAVGAVDREGVIAPFSSLGDNSACSPPFPSCDPNEKPEIIAPGVEIATVLRGGTYAYVSGTSPAAAIVSGIVALLLDEHPEYRHDATRLTAFKAALMDGAKPSQGQQVPHDDRYGYGIVQAAASESFLRL